MTCDRYRRKIDYSPYLEPLKSKQSLIRIYWEHLEPTNFQENGYDFLNHRFS
jgi:hypothetical protein